MGGSTADIQEADRAQPDAPTENNGQGGVDAGADNSDLGGILPLRTRLVMLSFLQLFAQLALIRWLGAQVVYMSFYSNFVLLASFLGFGLGFLWVGVRKRHLFPFAPLLIGALVAFVAVFNVPLDVTTTDIIFFETAEPDSVLPMWAVLLILFVAVAAVGTALGEGVARTFARFRPLEAYKLDLIGSVLGIAGFAVMSFLGTRPLVWGLIMAVLFLITLPLGTRGDQAMASTRARLLTLARRPWEATGTTIMTALGLLILLAPLAVEARSDDVAWSPYYRITHEPSDYGGIDVDVNQSPHWSQLQSQDNPLYTRFYDHLSNPRVDSTLVIGSGSGNDVSLALDQGAQQVDAVEIDPQLMDLAQEHHPDEPFDDPRVTTHIDDGRAFLERSSASWDHIIFALPDSLALVERQSAIRLESYLFTVEAIEAAQERLEPGGVFTMYNWYREDWLVDRFANTLSDVFDEAPCVNRFADDGNLAVLVASDDPAALNCPDEDVWDRDAMEAAYEADDETLPSPVVDDRPFPYVRDNGFPVLRDLDIPFLKDRGIPGDYVVTGLGALAISLLAIVAVTGTGSQLRSMLRYSDLFFMGVAFLLLETKNVTQFALLFGTTWFVNALVFMGVLLSILTAVAISRRVTFKRPARLYVVLLAALALAYVIPQHALLELPIALRFVAATTLAFFPVFTANLVFAQRFKDTGKSTVAFGANLLGAMFGGILEYASIMVGFNGLLIVAAAVYGLAFLSGRKHLAPVSP